MLAWIKTLSYRTTSMLVICCFASSLMSLQSSQLTSSVPDVILALQSLAAIVTLKGINTAIINATGTGSNRLFLILLGGDLFGHIPN